MASSLVRVLPRRLPHGVRSVQASLAVLRNGPAASQVVSARGFASSPSVAAYQRSAPEVTYEQLKPWTEQPSLDRVIVDVREVNEVEQGSIPSAVNVPLSVLPKALEQTPDAFRNTYGFEQPDKNKEIVFYCRSGKRSTTASDLAIQKGWNNVKNYTGSWLDWVEKEQGKK